MELEYMYMLCQSLFILRFWKYNTIPSIFVVNWVSSCLSFFLLSASTAATHIFTWSYLYNYYNYSRTLCIKCWVSVFRTELQRFILWFNKMSFTFADTTERGDRGWKEAQIQGYFTHKICLFAYLRDSGYPNFLTRFTLEI
jgi:hypothetical protein